MPRTEKTEEYERLVAALADGKTPSSEIARKTGLAPRHVRKILLRLDLPRLNEGAMAGDKNHQFQTGRRITTAGYVLITTPEGHTSTKRRSGRNTTLIWEHRYVLEQKLGRLLLPSEAVDHADGLTLHNHPDNLRLFASNAEHLRETLAGKVPRWSEAGYQNMKLRRHQPEGFQRVDTYRQSRAAGAPRLLQILLAALRLGTDSPYLSGSSLHTTKAGIDMSSRSTIERALDDLCQQWGWDHIR